MILHAFADWIRPERVVGELRIAHDEDPRVAAGIVLADVPADARISYNEDDEKLYVHAKRWRWQR